MAHEPMDKDQPLHDQMVGRRIVDVRFVSDDRRVRPIFKGKRRFGITLRLDDGTDIELDLHSFSLSTSSAYRIPPSEIPADFKLRDGMSVDELPPALRGDSSRGDREELP
jgi:hypothetical protein